MYYIKGCTIEFKLVHDTVLPFPSPVDKDMEEKALTALNAAQKKIKLEIQDLNERVKVARESTQKLKEQIEQAETTDNS